MDRTKEEILKAKQLEKYCGGCKKMAETRKWQGTSISWYAKSL